MSILVLSSSLLFQAKAQCPHAHTADQKTDTHHHHNHYDQSATAIAAYVTQQLAQKLELSEEQTEKISAINLKYAEKMHTIHSADPHNQDSFHGEMKTLHEAQEVDFKAVLTAEQFAQYHDFKTQMHQGAEDRQ